MIKVPLRSGGVPEKGAINSTWCFQEITEERALNLKGKEGQAGQGSEGHFRQSTMLTKAGRCRRASVLGDGSRTGLEHRGLVWEWGGEGEEAGEPNSALTGKKNFIMLSQGFWM